MKKFVLLAVALLFNFKIFSADYSMVNRKTAVRCLKLAESCLTAQDWQNALNQAKLGLSYDDSISDLIYVQAASLINMNCPKKQVIELITKAFEKDNWVDYTKNGARILLADLLSDTGGYAASNLILDSEPFIYSADAEFIRIKNYYRIADEKSINQARTRVNSARRIYPGDKRFDEVFLNFETLFQTISLISGQEYEIPEIVQNITASYVAKLPDYDNTNPELEVLACCLAKPDVRIRLIKAILAKNNSDQPLLPILALENGIIDEKQAVEMFFDIVGNDFSLYTFERLLMKVSEEEVLFSVAQRMNIFAGTINIDHNYDLQNEIRINYENGRPLNIHFDENNDDMEDLYVSCDFGAPQYLHYPEKNIEFFYDSYPYVNKINYSDKSTVFNFLHNDYSYAPLAYLVEPFLSLVNFDFYIPFVSNNVSLPALQDIANAASSVELATNERPNSTVNYTIYEGNIVLARFFENRTEYAYCDFEPGLPLKRYADYDNDGFYETVETFENLSDEEGYELPVGDRVFIRNVFGDVLAAQKLYLTMVQIDRNANTFYEFEQNFIPKDGTEINWDYDDNGVVDCRFIQEPLDADGVKNTHTIFYAADGSEFIKLSCANDLPIKMDYNGQEVIIYAGINDGIYWIEKNGSEELEQLVFSRIAKGIEQGVVTSILAGEFNQLKISIIKVDNKYFCKIIDELTVEEIINE